MSTKRLKRWCASGMATVLLGVFVLALLAAENTLPARAEAKATALPSDLAKVPSDGVFIMSVRIADQWNGELGKPVREKLAKDLHEPAREFEKHFGLSLEQVERLTMVVIDPPPTREEPLLFLRTTKPYDRAKVIAVENAKEQKHKGQTFFVGDEDWAVYPLDDQAVVYGTASSIRGLLDHPAPKTAGNLAGALRLAASKHALTMGLNVKTLNDAVGDKLPGEVEPFKPLLEALAATLAVDLAEQSRVEATLTFPTEKEAKGGAKPLKTGLDLASAAIDQGVKQLVQQKEPAKLVELLKQAQGALKAAKIAQEGPTLHASVHLKIDAARAGVGALEGVQKVREAASRTQSVNSLKQIALAMHNFNDNTGSLPAHASYDKNGKPMLSWRVLILPYIGQNALYKQFHLNEPWDSEHNKKLLAKMPKLYVSPSDEKTLADHTTYYQGLVGKGAFFEGKKGLRLPVDFPDGTSNTIMIVEGSKAVPWTKPEDIVYDAAKPLPKLGHSSPRGFLTCLCDGSVRFISKTISEETLRNVITRNDGNVLGADF